MKSTFTAVLWFYDDEKLEERRREILEEIRRNWWRRISEAQGQGSAQAEPTA
jgi:hypothetical protein